MLSNLRRIVSAVAAQKELTIESYKEGELKLIEKHLDASGDIDAAMDALKKLFDYKWKEKKAFQEIEEQLRGR